MLIDFYTDSPVHVLMLSIQAVRGLPRTLYTGTLVQQYTGINY